MTGAVSALFLLVNYGRVLVWRDNRGDVSAVQARCSLIKRGIQSTKIRLCHSGVSYMFIQYKNLFLKTASTKNSNAASLLVFLHRVVALFKHYFDELEEESLRDNFVVARPPMAVTNAVTWPSEGIRYKNNEWRVLIFLSTAMDKLLGPKYWEY